MAAHNNRTFMPLACVLFGALVLAGCRGDSGEADRSVYQEELAAKAQRGRLTWSKQEIEHPAGYQIRLGHYGHHFHFNDPIEPAAEILDEAGNPVRDAVVRSRLVSDDGETELVEAVNATYETEGTPAGHYAGAEMTIPEGAEKFRIRFEIELPSQEQPWVRDIEVIAH